MINLKEIYESRYYHEACSTDGPVNFIDVAILAMRDACNQAVDLCAENVRASVGYDGEDDTYNAEIDKESILKTKDQIA